MLDMLLHTSPRRSLPYWFARIPESVEKVSTVSAMADWFSPRTGTVISTLFMTSFTDIGLAKSLAFGVAATRSVISLVAKKSLFTWSV